MWIKCFDFGNQGTSGYQRQTVRVLKILPSNYQNVDLTQVVQGAKSLNYKQKRLMLKSMTKYEEGFNCTLGREDTESVN